MARPLASALLVFLLASNAALAVDLVPRYAAPFSTMPMYDTNFGVTLRDWNGDGVLDVTVACNANDRVSTLKGAGHGAFGERVDFVGPDGPYIVAGGDINGDGTADMVVAQYDGNSVRVYYLLPGEVSYSTFVEWTTGLGPINVEVADIDQDGDNDIVTSNFVSNNISVLRNGGGGAFLAHEDYATGVEPWGMAVGHVNSDSYPDIVTANFASNSVTTWLGSASGTLAFGGTVSAGSNPTGVALLDYDGDGDRDAVACNLGSSNITLLNGNGSGTLSLLGNIPSLPGFDIVAADFNNDARLDLAVAGSEDVSGLVGVHLGLGSGGLFGPLASYATGGELSEGIAAGDLDGDGKLDLAVGSFPRNLSILRGNGNGSFGVDRRSALASGQTYKKLVLAEMTGDAQPDLVLAGSPSVRVAQGNGAGDFSNVGQSGTAAVDIAVVDLDLDGDRDVASINGPSFKNLAISMNAGNGTLSTGAIYGLSGDPVAVAAGDLNHDGYPDLVVACITGELYEFLNQGDGFFDPPTILNVGSPRRAVALVDLNGDTHLDIVVAKTNEDFMEVYLADGVGGFSLVNYETGDKPISIAVGDFNVDGNPDLAVACEGNTLSVFLNSGAGSFPPATTYSSPGVPGGVFVGSADADAYPDLFVLDRMDYSVSILTGNPGGAFTFQARAWGLASVPEGVAIGDVNGDGRSDIMESCNLSGSGFVQVLLYDTAPLPDQAPAVIAPASVHVEVGGMLSLTVTAKDSDLDAIQSLTADGLPPTATFTPNGDNSSGTFSWTPAATDSGTYAVSFMASNELVGTAGTIIHVYSGPAGYWKLNGNGIDEAGGAHLANLYGHTLAYVPGMLREALQTDTPPIALTGVATANHSFPLGQPRTLECWAKVVSNNFPGAVYELVSAVDFAGQWWRLYLLNQTVTFEIQRLGQTSSVSTPLPGDGAWHHFAVASDGSNMTLYVDGAPQGMATVTTEAIVAGGAIYIGVANGSDYVIQVDEVRLWHVRRTQTEILARMNQEIGGHVTDVESSPPVHENGLAQNRPNPFNPRTEISFELARGGPATLRVYDAGGRLVRTLVDRSLEAGLHRVAWDGMDDRGRKATSGVYFYRLEAPEFESARRMLLLK